MSRAVSRSQSTQAMPMVLLDSIKCLYCTSSSSLDDPIQPIHPHLKTSSNPSFTSRQALFMKKLGCRDSSLLVEATSKTNCLVDAVMLYVDRLFVFRPGTQDSRMNNF